MLAAIAGKGNIEIILASRLVNQLIFLFTAIVNEIQNGPVSKAHQNVARTLLPDDRVITFNWDTLMDRALAAETSWRTDFGYQVVPHLIYRDGWVPATRTVDSVPLLLKLHGSTNWLTSYNTMERGKPTLMQTSDPGTLYVYESTDQPYATYAGRFMAGYELFHMATIRRICSTTLVGPPPKGDNTSVQGLNFHGCPKEWLRTMVYPRCH